jgi:uncharacterized protein (DUF885 family)
MIFLSRRTLLSLGLRIALVCMPVPVLAAGHAAPNVRLAAFFETEYEFQLREHPESATDEGRKDFDDRLTDLSPAAIARRKAHVVRAIATLDSFDARRLGAQDRLSRDIMLGDLRLQAEINRLYGDLPFDGLDDWLYVSPRGGPHAQYIHLVNATTFDARRDYENYLKRLTAIPTQMAQTEALMRVGMRTGWMPLRDAIEGVPAQLDAFVVDDATAHPLYRPFLKMSSDVPDGERDALRAAASRVIGERVVRAFVGFRRFLVDEYLPAARRSIAVSSLPGGAAYYALAIRTHTSAARTPEEIRDLGLREVERIGREMDTQIATVGFAGDRIAFLASLRADERFLYARPEDKLKDYRDIAKRVDAELPRLFMELPRLPYGIRAMEAFEGDAVDHYSAGAADGSRAGWYEANVLSPATTPRYEMESTFLHEAVPGHHLQTARASELKALPRFRRSYWATAYGEGWALYAEGLGTPLGLYADPYSRIGRLSNEMVRAARLVVDTGLHAFGWSRAQAIAYLRDVAGLREPVAVAETDRYISWPGQALAYKIGELKIIELRDRARAQLGDRFDLRAFHNAVLDDGALPLATLEQKIDRWIADSKHGARTSAPRP